MGQARRAAALLAMAIAFGCDGSGGGGGDLASASDGGRPDGAAQVGDTASDVASSVDEVGVSPPDVPPSDLDERRDVPGAPDSGDVPTEDGEDDTATPVGPLALAPGEAVEIPFVRGQASAALATPDGDESFLLVLGSTLADGSQTRFAYELLLDDAARPPRAPATAIEGCAIDSEPWSRQVIPGEPLPTGPAPVVGEQRVFRIPVGFGSQEITAEIVEVGDFAVVWADVTPERPAELEPGFVAAFLADFEEVILPRARSVFGVESDLDGDGRISLLFSPLTYDSAVAFFSGCDLREMLGCHRTNAGEVLYVTPPNVIVPPYDTPNAMKEILAHELQHLLQFGRQVLGNGLSAWPENSYLLEGFAALSQDVTGYQAGNFYVTLAGLQHVDDFSFGDVVVPWGAYDTPREGALRGGAYLFARWLYDRAGGDEALPDGSVESRGGPALLRTLMGDPRTAGETLPEHIDGTLSDVAMDWFTALALSNREAVGDAVAENPCFRYLPVVDDPVTGRQRGADLFAGFHGQQMNGPAIQAAGSADGSLLSGGLELLRLEAGGGAGLSFTIEVDPSAQARLRLARVR